MYKGLVVQDTHRLQLYCNHYLRCSQCPVAKARQDYMMLGDFMMLDISATSISMRGHSARMLSPCGKVSTLSERAPSMRRNSGFGAAPFEHVMGGTRCSDH